MHVLRWVFWGRIFDADVHPTDVTLEIPGRSNTPPGGIETRELPLSWKRILRRENLFCGAVVFSHVQEVIFTRRGAVFEDLEFSSRVLIIFFCLRIMRDYWSRGATKIPILNVLHGLRHGIPLRFLNVFQLRLPLSGHAARAFDVSIRAQTRLWHASILLNEIRLVQIFVHLLPHEIVFGSFLADLVKRWLDWIGFRKRRRAR